MQQGIDGWLMHRPKAGADVAARRVRRIAKTGFAARVEAPAGCAALPPALPQPHLPPQPRARSVALADAGGARGRLGLVRRGDLLKLQRGQR